MSLIRYEDRCCCIIGIFSLVSSLSVFVTIVLVLVLCACSHCAACFVLSVAPPRRFTFAEPVHCTRLSVRTLLCAFVPSNAAFWAKLRANRFLQSRNNLQPANDGADTTKSEDRVWRLQHRVIIEARPDALQETRDIRKSCKIRGIIKYAMEKKLWYIDIYKILISRCSRMPQYSHLKLWLNSGSDQPTHLC